MNTIDNDPLKIQYQLDWFKKNLSGIKQENLNLVNIIVKRIIFLKVGSLPSERFMNSVVYDSLCCLNEINTNKERYFYFSYRSLIENLARSCLNKENNDEARITSLFGELKSILRSQQIYSQDIYSDLNQKYSIACSYVHNNQSSGLDVMVSYSQIVSAKTLNQQGEARLLQQLLSLLEDSIRALSLSRKESILRNFGRNFLFIRDLLPNTLSESFLKDNPQS